MGKRINDMKSDDVFQFYINAFLNLIEPHTGYMEPIASENFEINMKLSLEGIGAVFDLQDHRCTGLRCPYPH